MAKKGSNTAKPFKYRGQWRMQVTLANGTRPCEDFEKYADAVAWGNEQLVLANSEHAPVLGGPTRATLAQALDHYARHCSVSKDGAAQELTRINHYLEGAGMPLLEAVTNGNGGCTVQEMEAKTLSPEFQAYVDKRRAARAGTFAYKFRLAKMRCGQISNADIKGFETQMINDGLSESSIQKEIALLKVFYNNVGTLNWKGLENPCLGIKLGKSQRRFVHLTAAQKMALTQALQECDNPYFMPLILTAKESTLRLDTLVNMSWSNTSVEERTAYLPTKTGTRPYTLSKEVRAILAGLPQAPDGMIFPMSKSAINSTWDRVRLKCGLPKLQFRDLRHLGATDWVRRGLSAHQLKQVLGHDSIATAQFYVDLVGKDLEEALDKASGNAGVLVMPAVFPKDPQAHLNQRRAERLNKANVQSLQATPAPESVPLPEQEISGELSQASIEPGPTVAPQPSRKVISLDAFRKKAA